jgi:transposase
MGTQSADGRELRTRVLGALPVVNHLLARLGLDEILDRHLPDDDARCKLAPATVVALLVRNLVLHREPVYALREWATPYDPGLFGLQPEQVALLNDDRVGRVLDKLFDADRASLFTEVVLAAVREFAVDTSELHNDSTSVSFTGAYRTATGARRGGQPTPAITHGHSKDRRPDLKQLVWILTVAADGAVPVAFRVADGNTSDDPTHVDTWDHLVALLGRTDFLYVADCKLANRPAMDHIHHGRGRFVTVLPASRAEDAWFRRWVTTNTPTWAEAMRKPGRRTGDPDDVWSVFTSPQPSAEGYRIVWVHSTSLTATNAETRRRRIAKTCAALDELGAKLAGPKTRYRDKVSVQRAAQTILDHQHTNRFIKVHIGQTVDESFRQDNPGRPGPTTRYRRTTRPRFTLTHTVNDNAVTADAASDGCFPLISNDTTLTDGELLTAYKYQPHLERRHHQLKGVQLVALVFLKTPARIEALLSCHFLALLVQALLERETRTAMRQTHLDDIPLYPELRRCTAPSADRILDTFTHSLARHDLYQDGRHIDTFHPNLNPLQRQVLKLLGAPTKIYMRSGE